MAEQSLAQKLQIKPGRSVAIINAPEGYAAALTDLPPDVSVQYAAAPADIIQIFVQDRAALEAQAPQLKPLIKPNGMLWVTYRKGTAKIKTDIHRDSIAAYAHTIGLTPVAIIAIDGEWSALRLNVAQPA